MSLLRAFTTVGSYTLLSRFTGFLRDILTASFLGAGAAADAFLIAFQFPNLFRRLFAEGAFSAGFVPIFAQAVERDGPAKAKAFADDAASMLAAILAVFCVIMVAIMPLALLAIAPGFDRVEGQMERATDLARITFPYLFFISLVSLQSGVLNALNHFAAAAATPILLNLTIVVFLLASVPLGADTAVFMAFGVSVAGVLQYLWLAHHCRRAGVAIAFRRPRLTPEVKDLLKRMLPVAFGAGIYQLNLVANNIMATLVSVGAVSWLYFADRVNQLPLGVVGVAVGVALLPLLSRQIQSGNEAAALANQNRAIEVCLLLTLPAAAGIGALAEPVAATLFERGAFTPADREAVAAALLMFSLGLPAFVLNKALTPGFFGRHDTATPVKISVGALIANVGISLVLMQWIGHVGIALATSLSGWINAGLLAWVLHARGHLVPDERLRARLPRLCAATGLMIVALLIARAVTTASVGPVFGLDHEPAGAEIAKSMTLAALIAVGGAVFVAAAVTLRVASWSDIAALRRAAENRPPPMA
ncbi:MAG: murein biosynthesis integral membrane protein MurJ [Rhodospirillaceae bacterium]|nr:murein biosynthesis integral membrane protein MurJ [Rhodospirillaceae bacterium]